MPQTDHPAPRRALVVRGGWEGHSPVETTDHFIPFLSASGFEVDVLDSPAIYADAAYMAGVDLILQSVTMSTIEADEVAGLIAAVEAGTGLAGWHGGLIDSYRASSAYLQLIGAQFAAHPSKHPDEHIGQASDSFFPHTINLTDLGRSHAITAGIDDFDLDTEQYWVLTDDLLDVLATTTGPAREWDPWKRPVTSPAVWTREWGQGRIFACTPGHDLATLRDPNVETIVQRGLLWASR